MIAHDKSQARVGAPYVRGCTHAFCGCYDLRDEDGVYVNGAAIDDASRFWIVILTPMPPFRLREV
jgi:hypothetical protein